MSEDKKEDFLPPDKVYVGMKVYRGSVTFEVVEHNIIRGYKNKRTHMIAYVIRDGKFTSPVARIFCNDGEDVRKYINEVIDFYLRNKEFIQRMTGR